MSKVVAPKEEAYVYSIPVMALAHCQLRPADETRLLLHTEQIPFPLTAQLQGFNPHMRHILSLLQFNMVYE